MSIYLLCFKYVSDKWIIFSRLFQFRVLTYCIGYVQDINVINSILIMIEQIYSPYPFILSLWGKCKTRAIIYLKQMTNTWKIWMNQNPVLLVLFLWDCFICRQNLTGARHVIRFSLLFGLSVIRWFMENLNPIYNWKLITMIAHLGWLHLSDVKFLYRNIANIKK